MKYNLNKVRFLLPFAILGAGFLFADQPSLEMTCEHMVIPQSTQIIAYVTLYNKSEDPIEVITFLPNAGASSRGGSWMLFIKSSAYAEESENRIPIRKRLLPRVIPPHGEVSFSVRFFIGQFSPIDQKTYVECAYEVLERDAKRYGVWGGSLVRRSTFVPFYEVKE